LYRREIEASKDWKEDFGTSVFSNFGRGEKTEAVLTTSVVATEMRFASENNLPDACLLLNAEIQRIILYFV